MTGTILRGRVLIFHRQPETIEDEDAWTYLNDGGIAIGDDGGIAAVGEYDAIAAAHSGPVTDHRPHLITAGFIDPHIHFVQMQVVGSYAGNLLEWLNTYTFVEEQRFADPAHGARIAAAFFDELVRNGTTTAAAYCSVHKASAEAFFAEAERRNMAMVAGKCLMDRNCPPGLQDTPQTGYDDTRALIGKWHGRGRARYAITPRFAITSTPEQMEMIGALASEYPQLHIQTHLSENHGEIELAGRLFPGDDHYTGIYHRYGLLRPKALYGHCIHLTGPEAALMAETGAVAVSCPTSNLFLGSGLFDLAKARKAGVPVAVATDIGGGTSYSQLRTLDEFYKVQQLAGGRVFPQLAFYMATLGNAVVMGMDSEIGSVAAGKMADLVVLDAAATPAAAIKMERVETLAEELFLLQTLGDDRSVVETYVAGTPRKSVLAN